MTTAVRALVVVLWLCAKSSGAEAVEIVNTMPEPVYIWVMQTSGRWESPVYAGRGGVAKVPLGNPGKYYVNIRDSHNRDLPVGWVDLHELAESGQPLSLLAIYKANGWLRGWRRRGFEWEPLWQPLSNKYAIDVALVPFGGMRTVYVRELHFVNRPDIPFSQVIVEIPNVHRY